MLERSTANPSLVRDRFTTGTGMGVERMCEEVVVEEFYATGHIRNERTEQRVSNKRVQFVFLTEEYSNSNWDVGYIGNKIS